MHIYFYIYIYLYHILQTKGEVYLAALWALKPSFETSHLQADDSTAPLIVTEHTRNKTVKPSGMP